MATVTTERNPACAEHCQRDRQIDMIYLRKGLLEGMPPAGDGQYMALSLPLPLNPDERQAIEDINKGRENCTGPIQVATGRETGIFRKRPEIIWQCSDMPLPPGSTIAPARTAETPTERAPGFLQTVGEVIRQNPSGFVSAVLVDLPLGRGDFAKKE